MKKWSTKVTTLSISKWFSSQIIWWRWYFKQVTSYDLNSIGISSCKYANYHRLSTLKAGNCEQRLTFSDPIYTLTCLSNYWPLYPKFKRTVDPATASASRRGPVNMLIGMGNVGRKNKEAWGANLSWNINICYASRGPIIVWLWPKIGSRTLRKML